MKKHLPVAAITICFLILVACKKNSTETLKPETSDQLLTKVTKITQLNGDNPYTEVINYSYNDAGKLISEGDKTYLRDEQQRIVEVLDANTCTNRNQVFVYYKDGHSKEVVYTLANWSGPLHGYDSVVYVHDENSRPIKTMTYIHQAAGDYLDTINYYQYSIPDTTYLGKYTDFKYDGNGNIIRITFYSVDPKGNIVVCGEYVFEGYGRSVNPQYSDDEVRIADYSFYGTMNTSKNNFTAIGNLSKLYEYRTDGRPRTCAVSQNGVKAFTLRFEYH
jgi:hypothetical protein